MLSAEEVQSGRENFLTGPKGGADLIKRSAGKKREAKLVEGGGWEKPNSRKRERK